MKMCICCCSGKGREILCSFGEWSNNNPSFTDLTTVELQWLEHLWNHENMFETGAVRANEC